MSKYFGKIGYAYTIEKEPGVWVEEITEHEYFGDLIRNYRKLQYSSDSVNDGISFSNQISIVADPYAYEHFASMRYATFENSKWKISDVEVQYPRLILTLGGLYNGQ